MPLERLLNFCILEVPHINGLITASGRKFHVGGAECDIPDTLPVGFECLDHVHRGLPVPVQNTE